MNETEVTLFEETIDLSSTNSKTTNQVGMMSTKNGSHTINWWAPFSGYGMTGLACWRNVSFKYNYKIVNGKPRFTKVSNIKSYYSGIQIGVTWNQTSTSYNFTKKRSTNDKAVIKVNGYSLLGFEVKGFTVGAKINDTWKASLTLK